MKLFPVAMLVSYAFSPPQLGNTEVVELLRNIALQRSQNKSDNTWNRAIDNYIHMHRILIEQYMKPFFANMYYTCIINIFTQKSRRWWLILRNDASMHNKLILPYYQIGGRAGTRKRDASDMYVTFVSCANSDEMRFYRSNELPRYYVIYGRRRRSAGAMSVCTHRGMASDPSRKHCS